MRLRNYKKNGIRVLISFRNFSERELQSYQKQNLPRQHKLQDGLTEVSTNVHSIFGYSPLGPAVEKHETKICVYKHTIQTAVPVKKK